MIGGIIVSVFVIILWCCMKAASDEDDKMGYG